MNPTPYTNDNDEKYSSRDRLYEASFILTKKQHKQLFEIYMICRMAFITLLWFYPDHTSLACVLDHHEDQQAPRSQGIQHLPYL